VSLDALLRARRPVQLADLIDKDRRRVSVMDAQEEVARLFGKYNLVAAPVLDPDNRLVGVITVDDVVDVIAEEADEEIKALGGITSDEELSDSIWTIARGRFNWLLVNLATAVLAASVLGLFKGQLEKMVALAVLAPIVASQGGNAATQTVTVAVRALAIRELAPTKLGASCRVRAWSALSTAWPSRSSPVSRRLRGSMSPGSAS
jgi:magnesium transporter